MNPKRSMRGLCAPAAAAALCACSSPKIEGAWVEPVPGMEESVQGFVLEEGGTAASIGMATLLYERWERDGERLILGGRSLGNGRTIQFSDTLEIRSLTDGRLTLRTAEGAERSYERQR